MKAHSGCITDLRLKDDVVLRTLWGEDMIFGVSRNHSTRFIANTWSKQYGRPLETSEAP